MRVYNRQRGDKRRKTRRNTQGGAEKKPPSPPLLGTRSVSRMSKVLVWLPDSSGPLSRKPAAAASAGRDLRGALLPTGVIVDSLLLLFVGGGVLAWRSREGGAVQVSVLDCSLRGRRLDPHLETVAGGDENTLAQKDCG